jgi:hypothetical protein
VLELDGLTRRFGDVVALDDLMRVRRPERRRQDHRDADRARRAQPDAGEVRWNGGAVDAPTRARFGYMPEERGLYIPPVAPMTMPPRIALGEASAVEVVGALAVTLGATALLVPLAARIYSGAVLRTGGTIKLREAWRAAPA